MLSAKKGRKLEYLQNSKKHIETMQSQSVDNLCESGVDFTHSFKKNHSFPHAVRILCITVLRVVSAPRT